MEDVWWEAWDLWKTSKAASKTPEHSLCLYSQDHAFWLEKHAQLHLLRNPQKTLYVVHVLIEYQ